MSNVLVFTPNAACSNLVVLRGIIPGASYDHTWFVEDYDCATPAIIGPSNYTGAKGFTLWFADAAGNVLVQVAGELIGDETGGKIQFPMTGADTELLRGQTVGACGAGYTDANLRKVPIESGRYHIAAAWPSITWPTTA